MEGKTPAAVRAQLGRFGFSGDKATTMVARLSGGERARLALALITREAPHLLILDEPTNHLDVDAREALVQALNGYEGAVILISHDRHMVEATADRLVLVDQGSATAFDGNIDDYIDFILGRNQPKGEGKAKGGKVDRKAQASARDNAREARKLASEAERTIARLSAEIEAIEATMADPAQSAILPELARKRTWKASELADAEMRWLELSEQAEQLAA
jgi:ATP-binding cassette subfamily F protein 3